MWQEYWQEYTMKKPKRGLIEIGIIIGVVILFRVGIVLVNDTMNSAASTNTATLPVHSGSITLTISNMEFHPATIVITSGSKITWVNHDPMAHTVTEGQHASATRGGFTSGILAAGKSWSYVFHAPGTYLYTCNFHPNMNAKVIVT
jgi:plastocyanin